ncbi:MAG: hypothetical protein HRU14_10145 [Planctomycetes bacterium]|nr:hypothetical protein [Planctomycetota bacterium]
MRGFCVLLLAIAIAIAAFVALREKTGTGRGGGNAAPPDTFSREHPGDHRRDEIRALEPKIVLVRGTEVWHGHVDVRPPIGVAAQRLEVVGPQGNLIVGADIIVGVEPRLSFSVPLDTAGALVARVLYDTGEVWSFSTRL